MYTLEEVKEKLRQRKLPLVAQETGLSYQTVRKVAAGDTKQVSYDVVKKLSDQLKKMEQV